MEVETKLAAPEFWMKISLVSMAELRNVDISTKHVLRVGRNFHLGGGE